MAALDEPDVRFVRAPADLLGRKYFEKLGMERALIDQEGEASHTTLLGSVAHSLSFLALSRRGQRPLHIVTKGTKSDCHGSERKQLKVAFVKKARNIQLFRKPSRP
jgi:hypothetical protein